MAKEFVDFPVFAYIPAPNEKMNLTIWFTFNAEKAIENIAPSENSSALSKKQSKIGFPRNVRNQ